jgi:hypothetical protein
LGGLGVLFSEIKNQNWVYPLFAGAKTLWNMWWRAGGDAGAPEQGRQVSLIKSGGAAVLLAAGAISAMGEGADLNEKILTAVYAVAGPVLRNFVYSASLAAAFAVGYLACRSFQKEPPPAPMITNHNHFAFTLQVVPGTSGGTTVIIPQTPAIELVPSGKTT